MFGFARIGLLCMALGTACAARAARASDEDPPDCPAWAKETVPEALRPFLGRHGLPEPWSSAPDPIGMAVRGIDRWQANHFIVYREQTRRHLYGDYTPTAIAWPAGLLPACQRLASRYTLGCASDREKALALLTRALPAEFRHPSIPPLGLPCESDRNLGDDPLLNTSTGFCNEQARIFVRLCQVSNIPARIIFLFYADRKTGHVVAEFFADGRWSMADTTWYCVFPAADGRLMNAAECHDPANAERVGRIYFERMRSIAAMDDEALAGRAVPPESDPAARKAAVAKRARRIREDLARNTIASLSRWLGWFGVLNYPLPVPSAPPVRLLRDGTPMGPIFLVDPGDRLEKDPRPWVKPAVEDLRRYLQQITGARFEVRRLASIAHPAAPGIYVGLDRDLSPLGVAERLDAARQESLIRTTAAGNLLLAGADPRGITHAIYGLLDELGCRWYFPGETFSVIPRQPVAEVAIDLRDAPAFPIQRRVWTGHGEHSPAMRQELADWRRRNRIVEPFGVAVSHTWFGLDPSTDFAAHPEWFALVDGQRKPGKPCYSHPQVIARGIDAALRFFDRNPDAPMFSVSAPDGAGYCACPLCLKQAKVSAAYNAHGPGAIYGKTADGREVSVVSETIFHFANEVAGAVARKYPGKRIGILAYSAYAHPPSFPLAPNLYVELTAGFRRTPLAMPEQIAAFAKLAENLGIYEYFDVEQWSWERPGAARAALLSDLSSTLRFYRQYHFRALSGEMSDNFAPNGIGYYAIARLLWNPDVDIRALEQAFYRDAFGPAAEPIQRLYHRWETAGWQPRQLPDAFRDLRQASELARNDPAVRARLDRLKMYAHFLHLYLQPNAHGGEAKDVEAWRKQFGEAGARQRLAALADWSRRLADTHMIHGLAFSKYLVKRGQLLGCDTTHWLRPGPIPTSAEIDHAFRDDLQELSPLMPPDAPGATPVRAER